MEAKRVILDELVKNGYAEDKGKRVWDIAERKFLYMTPESAKGFLKIRRFSAYSKEIVDRELALIQAYAETMRKEIGDEPFNLIDIYCGDGKKACTFIKALDGKVKVKYFPVNVNQELVDLALKNVKEMNFENVVGCEGKICDCDGRALAGLMKKLKEKDGYKRNVILLLGSVLASFDINDYLFEASKGFSKDDYMIIGNGVRRGKRFVSIKKYKHSVWDDWFSGVMKSLGFKASEMEYDARFNSSRVEGFYKLKKNKILKDGNKKVEFNEGDEIVVAILYKYYADELDKFCGMYFKDVNLTLDRDKEYAMVLCRK